MLCLFTDAAGKVAMKENATCEDIDIKVIFFADGVAVANVIVMFMVSVAVISLVSYCY